MRFHKLDDWLDWQSALHPREIELGLERVAGVWRQLRPAGLYSRVITVAGTNGKGSSVAMLEAIYLQANYRVGSYTSPHLVRYNERIRHNGEAVSDERICEAFERVDQARNGTPLTYFEFGTLAALEIFAVESPDLVILEVGLGGRLDAVNIIDPDVALITTVDLDHMEWLGKTKEEIGAEKAGIMRTDKPVVLGQVDMPDSVHRHAQETRVELYQLGRDFHMVAAGKGYNWLSDHGHLSGLSRPALQGDCQLQNAASVLMVRQCLSEALPVTSEAINRALRTVQLPGRMQVIKGRPGLILDVAHNPQAVSALRENLAGLPIHGRLHAIFGLLSDKDLAIMVEIMGSMIEIWYLVGTEGSRGRSAGQLKASFLAMGIERNISCFSSVSEALVAARSLAGDSDTILLFGSFSIVGEAIKILENEQSMS